MCLTENNLTEVKRKLELLPNSNVRVAFESIEHDVRKQISEQSIYYSPLFIFLLGNDESTIEEFENDLQLVVQHSNSKMKKDVISFLMAASGSKNRSWESGLFEIFVKSRFLKRNDLATELDYTLPNSKEVDLHINLRGKGINIECTLLDESDEDKDVWDKFCADKEAFDKGVLIRPGKYDNSNSKSPSPYYNAARFYDKVFDKIAPSLCPEEGQLIEGASNILIIFSKIGFGINWSLDELLRDQPWSVSLREKPRDTPIGPDDILLIPWLHHKAENLIREHKLMNDYYHKHYTKIVEAPRKIGAVMVLKYSKLIYSRVNYNSEPNSKISHSEISSIEDIIQNMPKWYN